MAGRRAVSRAPTRDLRAPGLRARRPASLDPAVPTAHPVEEAALVRAMTPAPPRTRAGGTRAVWTLLREDGWTVNRRRIERLWRLEGHRLPPRGQKTSGKRAQGRSENSSRNRPGPQAMSPLNVASYTGEMRSMPSSSLTSSATSPFCGKYRRDIAHTSASIRSGLGSPGTQVVSCSSSSGKTPT